MKTLRTPQQVLADFEHRGITISGWARSHGFSRDVVRSVLYGRVKGLYGSGHKVAVLLGLKDGVIDELK
ncbi:MULTISPECIES: DNA-binding protein [Pseudomonadaceae]|uniref:DNA-binding protein n=2 Tax=Metapseudomonas resinovorans TaxID=53412 RepID=S6AY33_METRE|nr:MULTISPECIES: DNA-binding protein [Pseudomonadaceae]BAN51428.1 hypothetical protein PCA10_p0440 [Pseudomonas resinovorans NBRC 106553]BAP40678.1 hypothetical protein [Pseudomonas resinovorans]